MSEFVLYRKYRPQSFEEVVGQKHVVLALINSLKQNRVAHAYLFSGPRGVGKTTIARLIAKSLNCLDEKEKPCNKCISCVNFNQGRAADYIEIDAASNRGIDEIRALREAVRYVPAQGKFKCYTIDEVHSLTKDAFNALLKTLEEPPAHAVFILATTEIEKVPPTIVSRTQHYDFRRSTISDISARLAMIAKKEGVTIDEDATRIISLASEGSLRDAESILGQIMAQGDKKISHSTVEFVLGLPKREAGKELFTLIAKKNISQALSLIEKLNDDGADLAYMNEQMLRYFRNALFLKTNPNLKKYVAEELMRDEINCIEENLTDFTFQDIGKSIKIILTNLQQFRRNPIPQLLLEITALELIESRLKKD